MLGRIVAPSFQRMVAVGNRFSEVMFLLRTRCRNVEGAKAAPYYMHDMLFRQVSLL